MLCLQRTLWPQRPCCSVPLGAALLHTHHSNTFVKFADGGGTHFWGDEDAYRDEVEQLTA